MPTSETQRDEGGRAVSSPSGLRRLGRIALVLLGVAAVSLVALMLFSAVVTDDSDTGRVTCPDGRTVEVPTQEMLEPTPEKIDRACAKN